MNESILGKILCVSRKDRIFFVIKMSPLMVHQLTSELATLNVVGGVLLDGHIQK